MPNVLQNVQNNTENLVAANIAATIAVSDDCCSHFVGEIVAAIAPVTVAATAVGTVSPLQRSHHVSSNISLPHYSIIVKYGLHTE